MKALTVRQPWAWAIIAGYKTEENRSKAAPDSVIGQRVAVHAGAAWSHRGGSSELVRKAWWGDRWVDHLVLDATMGVTFRAVLGTVEVVGTHPASSDDCDCDEWAEHQYERADGEIVHEVHHIVLARPVRYDTPIAMNAGRLGWWNWDPPCPHCMSDDIDRGFTGLDECRRCGGLSRYGHELGKIDPTVEQTS